MHYSDDSVDFVDKNTVACIAIMCLCLLSSVLLFSFSKGRAGMILTGNILLDIGLALFSMQLYFKKDNTKKRIIECVVFLLTISFISTVFKDFFSKHGMFAVVILFQFVGLIINIVDNLMMRLLRRNR